MLTRQINWPSPQFPEMPPVVKILTGIAPGKQHGQRRRRAHRTQPEQREQSNDRHRGSGQGTHAAHAVPVRQATPVRVLNPSDGNKAVSAARITEACHAVVPKQYKMGTAAAGKEREVRWIAADGLVPRNNSVRTTFCSLRIPSTTKSTLPEIQQAPPMSAMAPTRPEHTPALRAQQSDARFGLAPGCR